MKTLYHYIHCPFCVRVRMALGLLQIPYISKVVPYNDEQTPIALTGKKMLPIMTLDDGKVMNESLDIIRNLDTGSKINFSLYLSASEEIETLLSKLGSDVHSLCMPYWVWTPEFDENSRKYFQDKKEVKRGPFKNLIKNKDEYLSSLNKNLLQLESELSKFYRSEELTVADIMIASHLWGMYIFPEFQFSEKIHHYLQRVKEECSFDYHEDYWK